MGNCVFTLYNDEGNLVTFTEDICSVWVSFYSSLFTSCPVVLDIQARLLSNLTDHLPPQHAEDC